MLKKPGLMSKKYKDKEEMPRGQDFNISNRNREFMKKLILLFLTLSISFSAFSNCRKAYNFASSKRNIRNGVFTVIGTAGAVTAAIATGAAILIVPVAIGTAGTFVAVEQFDWGHMYKNNFDKALEALEAASNDYPSKYLNKVIKKGIRKANKQYTNELRERSIEILARGYEESTFCPVVKVSAEGDETNAVFNRSALAEFLSLNL